MGVSEPKEAIAGVQQCAASASYRLQPRVVDLFRLFQSIQLSLRRGNSDAAPCGPSLHRAFLSNANSQL
jgi:hypothetical protein